MTGFCVVVGGFFFDAMEFVFGFDGKFIRARFLDKFSSAYSFLW
jgi:hypothetical protein